MLTFLKWISIIILTIVIGIGLFLFGMRFHDGPNAIIAGGPFKTGELTEAPDDWSFLADEAELEFQTLDPATSRVVWLGVHDQRLYIISGYMNTTQGKVWKHWPRYLLDDDRIIIRAHGKLYEQRMVRLMDHPDLLPIMQIYNKKYGAGAGPDTTVDELQASLTRGDFWLFEVVDR